MVGFSFFFTKSNHVWRDVTNHTVKVVGFTWNTIAVQRHQREWFCRFMIHWHGLSPERTVESGLESQTAPGADHARLGGKINPWSSWGEASESEDELAHLVPGSTRHSLSYCSQIFPFRILYFLPGFKSIRLFLSSRSLYSASQKFQKIQTDPDITVD